MWNSFNTGDYSGMVAETISLKGHNGDTIRAYYSWPLHKEQVPGILLIPHMPGWDEFCREAARRFTEHGYAVICPDIYCRYGTGTPPEVSARMREAGGVSDECVMGDSQACIDFLKDQYISNDKVGVIGMCSGGRHTFLAACTLNGIDAAVDCWGGGVIGRGNPAPIEKVADLQCPLMGIFGNDDRMPDVNEVNETERLLKEHNKEYEFHRYDGAGHGIWYYDKPMYRQPQAMDSFNKVIDFFDRHLK